MWYKGKSRRRRVWASLERRRRLNDSWLRLPRAKKATYSKLDPWRTSPNYFTASFTFSKVPIDLISYHRLCGWLQECKQAILSCSHIAHCNQSRNWPRLTTWLTVPPVLLSPRDDSTGRWSLTCHRNSCEASLFYSILLCDCSVYNVWKGQETVKWP